jgi:hypothetical protein
LVFGFRQAALAKDLYEDAEKQVVEALPKTRIAPF